MALQEKGYQQVPQTSDDDYQEPHTKSWRMSCGKCIFLLAVSLLSVLSSTLLGIQCYRQNRTIRHLHNYGATKYAGLIQDVPKPYLHNSEYDDPHNRTRTDDAWDSISIARGMVALSDDYVAEMGLPTSQRFPWDESKGIYFLTAYHNLHCLKTIRKSVVEYQRGEPQTHYRSHVNHCLEGLLQTIHCDADDTPRYTTFDNNPVSGAGQVRTCRSWDRLEEWATENSACWKYVEPNNHSFPRIHRYKYCPPGSPHIPRVREYFGDDVPAELANS